MHEEARRDQLVHVQPGASRSESQDPLRAAVGQEWRSEQLVDQLDEQRRRARGLELRVQLAAKLLQPNDPCAGVAGLQGYTGEKEMDPLVPPAFARDGEQQLVVVATMALEEF